ncbi:MAG: gliding motility-associated C-terminal domain-containing protein, partial [Bacteroidia bacterium]|nr:gliding motility-associated C-terminal domain-containing protein [Bacteroidia bacterium]
LLQCVDDGYLLDIAFVNSDSSYIIESIQWTINDGGTISTQNGSSFEITSDAADLSVMLVVNYTNGCVFETEREITEDDFLPVLSIGYDQNIDCTGLDSIQLEFYPVLTGGNMDASPLSYMWTLDGELISTLDTVVLLVSTTNTTLIGLTVEYTNNCVFTATEEFTCPECERDPEILVEIDCADTEKLIVSLTDTTVLEQGITATLQQWTVDGTIFNGPGVTFEMVSTPVEVEYLVEYSDGCSGTYTQTFDPDDFMVELSYDVEVLECLFGYGTFLFTNTSTFADECVNIESIEWIIDGQAYTGDSVEVEIILGLTVDVELIIHFTNGTTISTSDDNDPTNDSVNTLDYIENVQFDIMDNTGVFCGDSINLSIVDPDPNLIYNWAFDSEFTNILFSGTELIIEANEIFNGLVFAQAISDSLCMYGQSLIELDDEEIILVFDTPFEICPGDTANFEIININPFQDITYTWKEGGDQLIDGVDTNNPLIGIPEDHTEDFFMILCTENTAGCTRVDSVFFEVGETEDLEPFSFDIDSCGSLTVNFTSNNTFSGTSFWDFGDGNTSNEANPSNTYPSPGTYLVVLSDSSDVCAKNSYMDSIVVPEMLYISIGQDTIEYGAGETVIVNAETNGPQDSIIWCLEDGTIIGMGNPLEYQPANDIEEVCAKITDEYGCSDSTCVILKLREDCPEELSIDGPSEICIGDTFELMLMMDQDPAEFIFLWDPSECIVSGGDTHNPTVTATTDKTFSVLVQKPGLCSDTIVSFNVSVSNPQVSITTENGEPNVCLGQEQTLLVVPDDPDCVYTWSTGETGPEIVVSPEVTTEYSVTCINNLGCESTSSFILEVILPECNENDVYLPNAFSPNGDNVNDVLLVRSKFIDEMEFYIVDRWGNEVFRTTDQNVGWDGTYKGEECSPDAYAYYLMVVCIGGDDYFTQGNVSIIK